MAVTNGGFWSGVLNSSGNSFTDVLKSIYVNAVGSQGISGFLFTQLRDEEVSLSSTITDYVVESGSSVQDNITLNPVKLKISGVAAEVSSKATTGIDSIVDDLAVAGTTIGILMPSLDSASQMAVASIVTALGQSTSLSNIANKVTRKISPVLDALGFNASVATNVQQRAFNFFYAKWKSRELVTVETPWAYFKDMAIEGVKMKQSSRTNTISDIEVTLKEIVFVSDATSTSGEVFDSLTGKTLKDTISGWFEGIDITGFEKVTADWISTNLGAVGSELNTIVSDISARVEAGA